MLWLIGYGVYCVCVWVFVVWILLVLDLVEEIKCVEKEILWIWLLEGGFDEWGSVEGRIMVGGVVGVICVVECSVIWVWM